MTRPEGHVHDRGVGVFGGHGVAAEVLVWVKGPLSQDCRRHHSGLMMMLPRQKVQL